MVNATFIQLAVLLFMSVIIGYFAIRIRQSLIFSFIIVGIIAGPSCLGWITNLTQLELLASFGVTLLLFIVGLKMDLDLIRNFGKVTIKMGLGQIFFTVLAGFILAVVLGFPPAKALFIAIVLTFSSTIIIIKLLSDGGEIDSLYGRISVGILIVQDLVVVLAIIVLSSLANNYDSYAALSNEIFSLVLKGIGFIAVLGLLMRFIIPGLLEQIARSRELLILFAFSWAVIFAVTSDALGFGKEVGGFLAGISLASTRFRESIASRLEPVRNLLLLFFFLNLGATFHFDAVSNYVVSAILLTLFVLIIKPLIVILLMSFMKFRKRTSFLTGLTMGQLSEFSLILAALGQDLGYIDINIQGLITFIALISIAFSTYLLSYANYVYKWVKPWLSFFERKMERREDSYAVHRKDIDIIIYGYGRHGENIAKILETYGFNILCVDFDPRKVHTTHHHRISIHYGDAEDAEFPKTLPLASAKWVVSTVPHRESNQMLVSSLRELHYQGKIALSAYHDLEIEAFKKLNVDLLLMPYKDAALSAAQRLAQEMG